MMGGMFTTRAGSEGQRESYSAFTTASVRHYGKLKARAQRLTACNHSAERELLVRRLTWIHKYFLEETLEKTSRTQTAGRRPGWASASSDQVNQCHSTKPQKQKGLKLSN